MRREVDCWTARPDGVAQAHRADAIGVGRDVDGERINDQVALRVVAGEAKPSFDFTLVSINFRLLEPLEPGSIAPDIDHDSIGETICGNDFRHGSIGAGERFEMRI